MGKNRILIETARRKEVEATTGDALPIPSYLFISRYGRSLARDFEELKVIGGYQDGFVFRVKVEGSRNLVHQFQLEAGANTKLGRKLHGLVLVDLGAGMEQMEEQELKSLLVYLKGLEPAVHCIFSMDDNEYIEQVEELLKQHFFIRTVEGEPYEPEEELDIVKEIFRSFHFELEPESEEVFLEFLRKYTWDEDDNVENRLQSLVKGAIYDTMLKEDSEEDETARIIDADEAREIVRGLEDSSEKKRVIGFQPGGAEDE